MILVERDNVYWVCKEGCGFERAGRVVDTGKKLNPDSDLNRLVLDGFESLDKAIDKMAINAPFEKSN